MRRGVVGYCYPPFYRRGMQALKPNPERQQACPLLGGVTGLGLGFGMLKYSPIKSYLRRSRATLQVAIPSRMAEAFHQTHLTDPLAIWAPSNYTVTFSTWALTLLRPTACGIIISARIPQHDLKLTLLRFSPQNLNPKP